MLANNVTLWGQLGEHVFIFAFFKVLELRCYVFQAISSCPSHLGVSPPKGQGETLA